MPLLEAVPNVSEGRDEAVVAALGAALAGAPGVRLLDVSSDPDHHRTVLTAAGEPAPLVGALLELARTALARIDLRLHRGVHPRLGAVDVVPFVPLADASMNDAVAAAEALAGRVGDELGVPVFLYGAAARTEALSVPAALRRRGLDEVARAIAAGELRPDRGPARVDPRSGVMLIGARELLVAWNVVLGTDDVRVARAVARAIRESDGGIPGVQALGFLLESRGRAQVSLNLLRASERSLVAVMERVREEAARHGVEIESSELVGLVPERLVLEAAAAALHLPSLPATQILEHRLRG